MRSGRLISEVILKIGVVLFITFVLLEIILRLLLGNGAMPSMSVNNIDGRCVALKPNTSVEYTGLYLRIPKVHQEVNALGYRGEERSYKKTNHPFRILMIGDSFTYGRGVQANQTTSYWLERLLQVKMEHAVEVLNFGCPALNLNDNLEYYKKYASQWEHDLVIYNFYINDFDQSICGLLHKKYFFWFFKNLYTFRALIIISGMHIPGENKLSLEDKKKYLSETINGFMQTSRSLNAKFAIVFLYDGGFYKDYDYVWFTRQLAKKNDFLIYNIASECPNANAISFFPGEGHYTAEGNRLVASCISDWLLGTNLIKSDIYKK